MALEHYLRTARLYWRYHRRWYSHDLTSTRPPSRIGRSADAHLHRLCTDLDELPSIVEALVATAPSARDLPLIGSDLLEDAYHRAGIAVFAALDRARLYPEHRRKILSGMWPSTLWRAHRSLESE